VEDEERSVEAWLRARVPAAAPRHTALAHLTWRLLPALTSLTPRAPTQTARSRRLRLTAGRIPLADVVLPHIGDPRGICYQRDPTFRCHVPGGGPPNGRPHCDASYGHSRAELNFWLPLTAVWGSNSLYSESAPGRADFAPFELHHGQIARFWGNQCHHYTTPNHTGSCRVSLDFRVVPRSCFLERYPGGMRDDGSLNFSIGGFFGWMGPDGVQVCSRRLQSAYPPSHVSPAGLRGDCDGGGDESDVEGSAWAHVWDEA
jgi:hypothetical protein